MVPTPIKCEKVIIYLSLHSLYSHYVFNHLKLTRRCYASRKGEKRNHLPTESPPYFVTVTRPLHPCFPSGPAAAGRWPEGGLQVCLVGCGR